jgi:outer membrane lipoprotein-sorting protein
MDVERQFERYVEGIGDAPAPRDEHRRGLRAQVVAAAESAGVSFPRVLNSNTRSRVVTKVLIRWFSAAAVLLVCVSAMWLYLSSPPSAAWADVAKNLNQSQTLSLNMTVYQGEKLRNQMAMSFLSPDRMRIESGETIGVFDWANGKMLSLTPQYKHAVCVTLTDKLTDAEKLEQRNWLVRLREIVDSKDAKEVGGNTFEGRACKGWQVVNGDGATTVWADEKTAQIVRVEAMAGVVRTVLDNFKFNPKLDESQFSLTAPEGYAMVTNASFAAKDASEEDILLLLRAWAGGSGGVFPESLMNVGDWFKAAPKYDWSKEKKDETTLRTAIGRAFFNLNARQDWVYRGKGVKLGDAKTAVFWRPAAKGKYRVIYGDLSVREVEKKDLPK